MPLFLFFLNKPLTAIVYLAGVLLLMGVNALDLEFFPFPFLFLWFSFTIWYSYFLIHYYVLRDPDNQVLGIEVGKFKHLFSVFLRMHGLAILIACLGIGYFHSSFGSLFFILAYTVISTFIFQSMIEAKLVSEGIKKYSSLKDVNVNEMYTEIRKIILTKVIQK